MIYLAIFAHVKIISYIETCENEHYNYFFNNIIRGVRLMGPQISHKE